MMRKTARIKIFHWYLRAPYPEVLLPWGEKASEARGLCQRPPTERGVIMALQQRRHILFVEDDTDTLSVTAAMLDRLGYSVRAETEGLNALQTFSEAPDRFDLALIEHGMADLTGLELAQRFRRIRPDFPVVIYTGYLDTPSAQQIEAAGIGGRLIIKPATMKELADTLQEALHEWARSKTEP